MPTLSREEAAAILSLPKDIQDAWLKMKDQWGGPPPRTAAEFTAAVQEMRASSQQTYDQKTQQKSTGQLEAMLRSYYQNPASMPPETAAIIPQIEATLERIKPGGVQAVKAGMDKTAADKKAADAAEADRIARQSPTYGMDDAQKQKYYENQALDERFGSKYSWLDPSFMLQPQLLGQSQQALAQSDLSAQLAQYTGLQNAQDLLNTPYEFMGPEQQQQMLDLVKTMAQKAADPRSFNFDTSGRQEEQYGNLKDIIAGGGADAIERARRLKQRQDSESWLRGQREADLQSYGERGLGGSGLELQSLSQAQQGAAGRNALADAEMAAELEKRKMDAIGSAANLASVMRGQAIDEQSLFAGNQQSILGTGATIANAMRQAQLDEQLGMRDAQNKTIGTYADLASKMRDQSFDEAYKRGGAADDFSKWNADTINAAKDSNVTYLRDQQAETMKRDWDTWLQKLKTATGAAETVLGTDERENTAGFTQGTNVGSADAAIQNQARDKVNNAKLGTGNYNLDEGLRAEMERNGMIGPTGQFVGQTFDEIIKAIAGGYGGGSMGGSFGSLGGALGSLGGSSGGSTSGQQQPPSTQLTMPKLGSSSGYGGGQSIGYDLNKLKGYW